MSAPTTLFAFCHAREVIGYCPAGVQGTIFGIAVDLSVLAYFLCPFPGPYRAGVPGRLVPVGSDCASWRGAVSRGLAHSQSEKRVRVGSGVLARPSSRRLDHLSGLSLGFWVGAGVERCSRHRLLGRAFAGKPVHEGPRVYEPNTSPRAPGRFG